MKFETSKNIDNWVKEHSKICKSCASAGEHYEFRFIPSGIVERQDVKCLICREEFTDYVD